MPPASTTPALARIGSWAVVSANASLAAAREALATAYRSAPVAAARSAAAAAADATDKIVPSTGRVTLA